MVLPTRPSVQPSWATSDNYPSGPDVGQPTKIPATAGEIASGHLREDRPPARKINWLKNLLCLWDNWAESAIDYLDGEVAAVKSGYAHFTISGTTYSNNDFLNLTSVYSSTSPRPVIVKLSAIGGSSNGDYIVIPATAISLGLWSIQVVTHLDPGTPDTTCELELIQHSGADQSAGTEVASMKSVNVTSSGTVKSISEEFQLEIDSVGSTHFSFRVDSASGFSFGSASHRRDIYVRQLSREIP